MRRDLRDRDGARPIAVRLVRDLLIASVWPSNRLPRRKPDLTRPQAEVPGEL